MIRTAVISLTLAASMLAAPARAVTPLPPLTAKRYMLVTTREHKILRFDADTGQYLDNFSAGVPMHLQDLAIGADGNLYASDQTTGAVLRYDSATGAPIAGNFIPLLVPVPIGMAFGPDGDLYLASRDFKGVLDLTAAPARGRDFSRRGPAIFTGPICCLPRPHSVPPWPMRWAARWRAASAAGR